MAMATTTSSQIGATPTPGIASKISPGSSNQRQPSTTKRRVAVARSTDHTMGGAGAAKKEMASEIPAMMSDTASRCLERPSAIVNGDEPPAESCVGRALTAAGSGPTAGEAGEVNGSSDLWD